MAWLEMFRSRKDSHLHGCELAIALSQSSIWNLIAIDWLSPRELGESVSTEQKFAASFTAVSADYSAVLKVQLHRHPRKHNDITQEAELLRSLSERGCVTAPALFEHGVLDRDVLIDTLPPGLLLDQVSSLSSKIPYLVEEYLPDEGAPVLADIILAMLEQKALGVYHGDVKPDNIRFDPKLGLCRFIDYDQAVSLSDSVRSLSSMDFLDWCDEQERRRYPGQTSWMRHLSGSVRRQISDCWINGSLDLAKTSICRCQSTTNSKTGIYHSLQTPLVSVEGSRTLEGRRQVLDSIRFSAGEQVLDVGCNLGILSHYLHDRGCVVFARDMDAAVTTLGGILARILGKKIDFRPLDIDGVESVPDVDTICLFSVIHHTNNMEENGKKIAQACGRIILECRLVEKGKKPVVVNGATVWQETSQFDFSSEEELENYLPSLFPGFAKVIKCGYVDKGRIVYELLKG